MRMWNEVATIFLVTIVFIVVLKNSINFLFASSGFIVLLLLLYFGIKLYKKYRQD
jgi:protoporphyrinogen IX oxidase